MRLPLSLTGRKLFSYQSRVWPSLRLFSSSQANHALTPFTRRLLQLPTAPSPPTQNHSDLTSFLSYASRTSLPPTSTVYVGTKYEYTVLESLRHYALSLDRIGGRDDAGIDLVGTWHLPTREHAQAVRVLVQCKALKAKLGPNLVRELEGTFRQAPVGWRTDQTVGVLVSPREATKGVREMLARSSYPLCWMMVKLDGTLRQALWNARFEELGLAPLGVETRYQDGLVKEVALTWDGCDVPNMDCVERDISSFEELWIKSWGGDIVDKTVLLDMVQKAFPDGYLDAGLDGSVSQTDRARFLEDLHKGNGFI